MNDRHVDDGSSIGDYTDHFLVECPDCKRCACTIRHAISSHETVGRFVCTHCGKTQEKLLAGWHVGVPRDWYFDYPLWLSSPCCGHELWAHNLEHLAYIESYISAKHRVRNPDPSPAIRNQTMASRFPKWMIEAKNRDEVLMCVAKLRKKAVT